MPIVSTQFFPLCIPSDTHLELPLPFLKTFIRRYHNHPNSTTPTPRVQIRDETRPTHESLDCKTKPHLTELLNRSCKSGKYSDSLRYLESIVSQGYKPDTIVCKKLIKGLNSLGYIEKALRVMEILELYGEPDAFAYNMIVTGLCKADKTEFATKVFDRMRSRGLEPDVVSYTILLQTFLNQGRWKDGEALLAEMVSRGCQPNEIMYRILIINLCRNGKVEDAVDAVKVMIEKGLTPDSCTFPVTAALCREGKIDSAMKLLDYVLSNGFKPSISNYNKLFSALFKKGNANQALEIFEKLDRMGCSPDVVTYNTMINGLWNTGDKARALRLVSEMISREIYPNEITYDSLISCLCRDGMVDEAIGVLRDMEANGFKPTIITYNTLILGFCKVHRICEAIDIILEEMAIKGCRPNESSFVILMQGVAYAGYRIEAIMLNDALVARNIVSKDSIKYLNKAFRRDDRQKSIELST